MTEPRTAYTAHYEVKGANDEVLYQGQVEVAHKGEENPETQESKQSLASAIFYSLDVTVTHLEKK